MHPLSTCSAWVVQAASQRTVLRAVRFDLAGAGSEVAALGAVRGVAKNDQGSLLFPQVVKEVLSYLALK
jgi:hypothetical protein